MRPLREVLADLVGLLCCAVCVIALMSKSRYIRETSGAAVKAIKGQLSKGENHEPTNHIRQ